ncbi:hypothetical protein HUT06_11210 [Actinomadura sp. NAK00032]|uniref:hypothetical protein n=1 Tax=Actinomadura sp. NAK00032 TaxID=2742128 RepID=UPI00158FC004|nr:hypothetical protein [Actinomadura sp. NAK00032]QKW34524.1 hypothetical protein HUT06_11210 [Actinomadura sp. NAK00032]
MRMRALLLAGLLLAAAACAEPAGGGTERPMGTEPPGTLANPRVMNCANRNAWFPEETAGPYRAGPDDLVAGDLVIPGLRAWADADPAGFGHDGRYKAAVLVRAGATATLSIPAGHHDAAGLLYAEATRDARTPSEGDHAITFTACPGHDTPFPGYLFVPRRQHVPLLVRSGREPAAREDVSFFAGRG